MMKVLVAVLRAFALRAFAQLLMSHTRRLERISSHLNTPALDPAQKFHGILT